MIDIENKVIDTVSRAFDGVAEVSSVYSPSGFPFVYVREISNVGYSGSYDNDLHEHHARIVFRIECYSELENGAKQEVKAMMQIADQTMQSMKFRRTSYGLIPNWDRAITRGYADYSALVGEPKEIEGNTVFQMYR
jgi:hypothetical protein